VNCHLAEGEVACDLSHGGDWCQKAAPQEDERRSDQHRSQAGPDQCDKTLQTLSRSRHSKFVAEVSDLGVEHLHEQ